MRKQTLFTQITCYRRWLTTQLNPDYTLAAVPQYNLWAFVHLCVCVCGLVSVSENGGMGANRKMRPQCYEATEQELVALNELLFCLRPSDYLGGSRRCDFIHISNRKIVIMVYTHTHKHTRRWVRACGCARRLSRWMMDISRCPAYLISCRASMGFISGLMKLEIRVSQAAAEKGNTHTKQDWLVFTAK